MLPPSDFEDEQGRYNMPELLPKQREAMQILKETEPESYTLLGYGGGMGGGKTFFNAFAAWQLCLAFPGNRLLVGRHELNKLETTTKEEFFRIVPRAHILKTNDSDNWVDIRFTTWPEGVKSRIYWRGLENWKALGSEAYGAIIIEEASEVSEDAAKMLLTRLRWRLPKAINRVLDRQCRTCALEGFPPSLSATNECGIHGKTIGNGQRFYYIATFNPWPSWPTNWFYKGQMESVLNALPYAQAHFVQSLARDNPHNGPNYEALNRATMTPDMAARMLDGRFDVFVGLVYEAFNPDVHAWYGPVPQYRRVIGGLDFGGESSTSHFTTGIVGIETVTGQLIRVDEFKDRGPRIYEDQAMWMAKMEEKWAKPLHKRIQWRADKSQSLGIKHMNNVFSVLKTEGKRDSVEDGVKKVAARLNVIPAIKQPGSYYLPEGHPQGGCPMWEQSMFTYRRDPETGKIIDKDDDLNDADRYLEEEFGQIRGTPPDFLGANRR